MRTKLDRLYKRHALARRLADVNLIDMPSDGDIPSDKSLSVPNTFPGGELLQDQNGQPELIEFGKTRRIEGNPEEKEAGGFGITLDEIDQPGNSSIMQNEDWKSYHDDNRSEDTDLHLGDVEEPYSDMAHGPIAPDIDDDKKYNIVRGANCKMAQLVFTDRYDALGIDCPDPKTMCKGQCEGTGWVPVKQDDEEEPWKSLWLEAEEESPTDDGWHFVLCPDCSGSGKRVARYLTAQAQKKVKPNGTIIAMQPPIEVAERIVASLPYTDIEAKNLHISVAYLSEEPMEFKKLIKIKNAIAPIADAHEPIKCKITDMAAVVRDDLVELMVMIDSPSFTTLKEDVAAALKDAHIKAMPAKADAHLSLSYNIKKLASKAKFVTCDGDDIGQQVGRMSIADDIEGLQDIDKKIRAGSDVFVEWAESCGGELIGAGGDEVRVMVPEDCMDNLDEAIAEYKDLTGFTISVGVGDKISEADKALLIAKFHGKDQVVVWEPEMEDELDEAKKEVLSGGQEKAVKHYLATAGVDISWESTHLVIMSGDTKLKVQLGDHKKEAQHQPWIAIDMDNTLLESSIGEPSVLAPIKKDWIPILQDWIDAGWRVSIFTARLTEHPSEEGMVEKHLQSQGVPYSDIWEGSKPEADVFIDDKAVEYAGDPDSIRNHIEQKIMQNENKDLKFDSPNSDVKSVALIDTQPGGANEEDLYTDGLETRQDLSIPRDPEMEGPLYGR